MLLISVWIEGGTQYDSINHTKLILRARIETWTSIDLK
jgi:hypothetical protein